MSNMRDHLSATVDPFFMDRSLTLEVIRVTEAAALAASTQVGRGDEDEADRAAVDAMRRMLNELGINGTVVIGEGERDEAPMLYIGEQVGSGDGPEVDIALDPLEGTSITACGGQNAMAVLAMADKGSFLYAPDVYMKKLAVRDGVDLKPEDLDRPIINILQKTAEAKGGKIEDLMVCILDRPRHEELIKEVRETGARITLIQDGDVSAVISAADPSSAIDVYVGIGGAPEGVLAAAALQCIGGDMVARLVFRNEGEKARAEKVGIKDFNKIYTLNELAKPNNVIFAATGVTDGTMLKGVHRYPNGATTYSVVMRSKTGTVRRIEAQHDFTRKPA
ncbi:MAG: class II fructose-bisphosphatase [Pseudobdellovibrionaceae bacterium]|jgi:fructose-1,6-bisphosphatase II / sedoheptulose-1,7-bisphosphatase|nr:class II fructose-bisphosphatase [Pseudobdellovibrionaceae bacterium]